MSLLARRLASSSPGSPGGATGISAVYVQPFLDDFHLREIDSLTISVANPTKDASNPLFSRRGVSDWDEDLGYVSVSKIGSAWHMFYNGDDGAARRAGYASSSDGSSWTRPTDLGYVSYGGNTANNILRTGVHNYTLFDDVSGKWVSVEEEESLTGDIHLYEQDTPTDEPTLVKTITTGTGNGEGKALVRRPSDGRWILYYVAGHASSARSPYAIISDTTSLSGTWTEFGKILASQASTNQFYGFGIHREGAFLYGMIGRYNSTSEQLWIDLFRSYDGIHWGLVEANWLDVGAATAWDDEMVLPGTQIVEDGDDWHIYYAGAAANHAASFPRGVNIGRATIPRGRIGSIGTTGSVTTFSIAVAAGATMTVNVDASGGGSLDIEVQDASGTPLTGFAQADFDTITTDVYDTTPTWSGSELPDDQELILKFVLSGATLYDFQISDAAIAGGPAAIEDLFSWCDAAALSGISDGATITQWDDRSGYGNEAGNSIHYAEPSYHTAVVNGLPAIRFNGSNEALYWVPNNGLPLAGPFTAFIVMKSDTTAKGFMRLISSYDGSGALVASEYILRLNATGGTYGFVRGTAGEINGGSTDTAWHYLAFRTGANGAKIREDGTEIATTATAYSTVSVQMYVGEDKDGAGGAAEYFDGDMAELIFYNRELSDAEVAIVESYLADKYAL